MKFCSVRIVLLSVQLPFPFLTITNITSTEKNITWLEGSTKLQNNLAVTISSFAAILFFNDPVQSSWLSSGENKNSDFAGSSL